MSPPPPPLSRLLARCVIDLIDDFDTYRAFVCASASMAHARLGATEMKRRFFRLLCPDCKSVIPVHADWMFHEVSRRCILLGGTWVPHGLRTRRALNTLDGNQQTRCTMESRYLRGRLDGVTAFKARDAANNRLLYAAHVWWKDGNVVAIQGNGMRSAEGARHSHKVKPLTANTRTALCDYVGPDLAHVVHRAAGLAVCEDAFLPDDAMMEVADGVAEQFVQDGRTSQTFVCFCSGAGSRWWAEFTVCCKTGSLVMVEAHETPAYPSRISSTMLVDPQILRVWMVPNHGPGFVQRYLRQIA